MTYSLPVGVTDLGIQNIPGKSSLHMFNDELTGQFSVPSLQVTTESVLAAFLAHRERHLHSDPTPAPGFNVSRSEVERMHS